MMTPEVTETARRLDELSSGYRAAQVLFAANRLGLFQLLGRERLDSDTLAQRMGADSRGTRILCDALAGLGLLEKEEAGYRNGAVALNHLVAGAPDSRAAQLRHAAVLYERWGGLVEVVKSGVPASGQTPEEQPEEGRRRFAEAMADGARRSAEATAERVDLSGATTMLDVGGGPGSFAIEFVRRNPGLRATILDDPPTLEVARENIRRAGLSARIDTRAGNAFEDDLGSGYDFIFLSNIIHIYSDAENARLVGRCARALAPGGRLCLKDFFLEEGRSGSVWALLFAVNMLVNTRGGDCYTFDQARQWFEAAGLQPGERWELASHSYLLLARK